jgi:hypothetical protein
VDALVADLDTTPLRVGADVVLLALVGINMYLGWRHGLIRRFFGFLGLFVGCFAATYVGNGIASLVDPHSLYANAWFFLGVVAVVVVIAEILGYLYEDRVRHVIVVVFDRVVGMTAGAVVGFFQASVAFLVALAVAAVPSGGHSVPPDRANAGAAVRTGMLSSLVVRAQPSVQTVFGPVLPSDLSSHLADGTQTVVSPQ